MDDRSNEIKFKMWLNHPEDARKGNWQLPQYVYIYINRKKKMLALNELVEVLIDSGSKWEFHIEGSNDKDLIKIDLNELLYKLEKIYQLQSFKIEGYGRVNLGSVRKIINEKSLNYRTVYKAEDKQEQIPSEMINTNNIATMISNEVNLNAFIKDWSFIEQIVNKYNNLKYAEYGVQEFENQYQNYKMGIENYDAWRVDKRIERIFGKDGSADYMYIPDAKKNCSGLIPVFLSFGITINRYNYEAGAIELVFPIHGFNLNEKYKRFSILKPAFFKERYDGKLELVKSGQLVLG